jgi:hypothetical protein
MSESTFTLTEPALSSLRGAFATRQSATAQVLNGIVASQVLLAMTIDRTCRFPVRLNVL